MSITESESITEAKVTPAARGKRVEILRSFTGLSRRLFKEKYGIPASSLQNWEDGKGSGLSEKGARKLIRLLKPDGIISSYEWLMYGTGQGPQIFDNPHKENLKTNTESSLLVENDQDALISNELHVFHQHFPNIGIDYVVVDDGMEPRFVKGEYVAGCRRHGSDIEKLVGFDCIIQTAQGDLLLRNIKKRELSGHYTLACTNSAATVERPTLYDVEILIAAPVIWARRKDSIKS